MPNRIIKESIHTSEDVNRMTDFQFRLWISLITYVDDYGRGDARPAVIRGACFPLRDRLTNKDVEAALNALADIGCVGLYEVDGRPYLYFPAWKSHQIIRNAKSKYPAPDGNCTQLQSIESNCNQLHAIESKCLRNPIQSESESESESNGCDAREARPNTRFTPPTVDEVRAYCLEKGYVHVNAERFVAYYEANGWKVGRQVMKNWRAAVTYWAKDEKQSAAPQTPTSKAQAFLDLE